MGRRKRVISLCGSTAPNPNAAVLPTAGIGGARRALGNIEWRASGIAFGRGFQSPASGGHSGLSMNALVLSLPKLLMPIFLAVVSTTVPFSFVVAVLGRLPKPMASSHRRWAPGANLAMTGAVTAAVAAFIRHAYFGGRIPPETVAAEFLVVALVYIFALVLLFRQFAGVYPGFIVTVGWTGLRLRKTIFRNLHSVEKISRSAGETCFRIETVHGQALSLVLPDRDVSIFDDRLRKEREGTE
jgi:hypothetical protein